MSATKDWPVVLDVEGLRCPVAFCWKLNHRVLNITMGGEWNDHVELENMDYMDAEAVKRGLKEMFQPAKVARMPESLRGLTPTLEAKIDTWFAANQSQ